MKRYPKLLPWRATKYGVEDDQAKLLWDYSVFQARLYGIGHDYETINELFDSQLKTVGFFNEQITRVFMPCKL